MASSKIRPVANRFGEDLTDGEIHFNHLLPAYGCEELCHVVLKDGVLHIMVEAEMDDGCRLSPKQARKWTSKSTPYVECVVHSGEYGETFNGRQVLAAFIPYNHCSAELSRHYERLAADIAWGL